MKQQTRKSGVSILVFTVLMSSFLLMCTGVWKTTTYLVDFALQKQVYVQNRYSVEGIMRWTIQWITAEWDVLNEILDGKKKVCYSLYDLPMSIERLAGCESQITIERGAADTCIIEVDLIQEQTTFLKARCNLTRRTEPIAGELASSFWVHDWYIGA